MSARCAESPPRFTGDARGGQLWPLLFFIGELRQGSAGSARAPSSPTGWTTSPDEPGVHAYLTSAHNYFGEVDDALSCGTRARAIAARLGDARLRSSRPDRLQILTASYLEQAYYYAGEYARVADLAAGNLAALPLEWRYEYFGSTIPASVYDPTG